jgi:hypothetical protein
MTYAACLLLTLGVLAYIFYMPEELQASPEKTRLSFLYERKDTVYENLRDLNFEYKAGKLPETDYHSMHAALEDEAASLLSEIERLENEAVTAPSRRPTRGTRN